MRLERWPVGPCDGGRIPGSRTAWAGAGGECDRPRLGPSADRRRTGTTRTVQDESHDETPAITTRRSRVVALAACLVAVVLAVFTLPGVDDVRARLASARPAWLVVVALCALGSMLGVVRALWAAFDRIMPWRRALVLGFAEQAGNVLIPAGGVGGPALGTLVMRRAGVPGALAARRHAVLFLSTSGVSFVALALAGLLVSAGVLAGDASP